MSEMEKNEKMNSNNSPKLMAVSLSYKKPKFKINNIKIEDNNFENNNILKNAGKELLESTKVTTGNDQKKDDPTSGSIINLKHKGIKKKGHKLYDPYLIQVCKNAIIRERNEISNYKDIIFKINTEYGIEEEKFDDINDGSNSNIVLPPQNTQNNYIYNLNSNTNSTYFNNSKNFSKVFNGSGITSNTFEKR